MDKTYCAFSAKCKIGKPYHCNVLDDKALILMCFLAHFQILKISQIHKKILLNLGRLQEFVLEEGGAEGVVGAGRLDFALGGLRNIFKVVLIPSKKSSFSLSQTSVLIKKELLIATNFINL